MTVIDEDGDEVEVPDGTPIPSGARLIVPLDLMDSATRDGLDDLKRRYAAKDETDEDLDAKIERLDGEIARLDREIEELDADDGDDGDEQLTADQRAQLLRDEAYQKFKASLDWRNRHRDQQNYSGSSFTKARKQRMAGDPSYQRLPGDGRGNDGKDAAAGQARDAAAKAYDKRNRDLENAYKKNRRPFTGMEDER